MTQKYTRMIFYSTFNFMVVISVPSSKIIVGKYESQRISIHKQGKMTFAYVIYFYDTKDFVESEIPLGREGYEL